MTDRSIDQLEQRWESLTSSDVPEVMKWLRDMFQACEARGVEVPNRHYVAARLGTAYNLQPDVTTSDNPPAGDQLKWLLQLSVNALSNNGPHDSQMHNYGITALAIHAWLIGQEGVR